MSLVASRICNGLLGPIILQYTCPDKVHTTCSIVYICNLFVSHSCPCAPFTWKNSIHISYILENWLSESKSKGQTVFSVLMGETFTAFEQPYFGIYIDLILKKRENWNMHRIIQYRSSFNSNHKHSQSVDLWDHLSFQLTVSAALVALGLPVWTSVDPWSQSFHLENQTSRW